LRLHSASKIERGHQWKWESMIRMMVLSSPDRELGRG
jgi:hypothetical protein